MAHCSLAAYLHTLASVSKDWPDLTQVRIKDPTEMCKLAIYLNKKMITHPPPHHRRTLPLIRRQTNRFESLKWLIAMRGKQINSDFCPATACVDLFVLIPNCD